MVVFPILTDTSLSSTTILDASILYSRQQNQLLDLGDLTWSLAPTFHDVNCGEPRRIRGETPPNPPAGPCPTFLTVRSNSIGPARDSAPTGIAPMQSLTQVILSAQATGSFNCEIRGALHAALYLCYFARIFHCPILFAKYGAPGHESHDLVCACVALRELGV